VCYFSELAVQLELSEFGSRLTVLDGSNASAFITDAMLSLDVATNFTRSLYDTRKFLAFYRILLSFFAPHKSSMRGELL